jgi:monofunctional biosynthetic peptidoglycan transglycosylase
MLESRTRASSRRVRYERTLVGSMRVVAAAVSIFLVLPYLITPFYWVVDPSSTLMMWRWVTGERVERTFVPLERMGPYVPMMVIIAEDGRFCSHWGVDFREIKEALDDAEFGGEIRGVSTITQQTVKNLFLWPGRSYIRKVLEAPLAMWFDLVLSKRRIMEIYLNIAEWGPNGEFGAQAAARRAFYRPAATLGPREAALLAAALPNPVVRDPRWPGPGLHRLAALYQYRASRAAPSSFDCVGIVRR